MIEQFLAQRRASQPEAADGERDEKKLVDEMIDEVRDDLLNIPQYRERLLENYSPFQSQTYGFYMRMNNVHYTASYNANGGDQRLLRLCRETYGFPFTPMQTETVEIATCTLDEWDSYPEGKSYLVEHARQDSKGTAEREANNIAAFTGARGVIAEFQTLFSLYE